MHYDMVTGPNGFLGRNFIDHLGERAFPIDNRYALEWESSLKRQNTVRIYNCAASAQPSECADRPRPTTINTVVSAVDHMTMAQVIMDSQKGNDGPKFQSFVHISSAEVYGPGEHGTADPFNPISPYAGAKAAQEMIIRSWAKEYNIPTTVVVTQNIFGPHQQADKFIPTVVRKLQAGEPVQVVHGIRAWTYAPNLVRVCEHLAKIQPDYCRRVHYHDGVVLYNDELVMRIAAILNVEPKIEASEPTRAGHEFNYTLRQRYQHTESGMLSFDAALAKTVMELAK